MGDASWDSDLGHPVGQPPKWEMQKRHRFGHKLIQDARGGVLQAAGAASRRTRLVNEI